MKEDAILATNTSSIPLEELTDALARPGRLVGLHFFNPTPNPLTVPVFEGLRFRHLDNGVGVLFNPLGALAPCGGAAVAEVDESELAPARLQHWMDLTNVLSVAPWIERPALVPGVDRPQPLLHLINGGEQAAKVQRAK